MHGGAIELESEVGRGTTFLVRLKIFTEQNRGDSTAPEKPKKRKKR
jgi:hypothetical protein